MGASCPPHRLVFVIHLPLLFSLFPFACFSSLLLAKSQFFLHVICINPLSPSGVFMRTRQAIEKRFRTLAQAYHFSHVHRKELTGEALAKHRALEENISLLRWCLENSDPKELTWQDVRETFAAAAGLLLQKLFGGFRRIDPPSRQDAAHSPTPNRPTR